MDAARKRAAARGQSWAAVATRRSAGIFAMGSGANFGIHPGESIKLKFQE